MAQWVTVSESVEPRKSLEPDPADPGQYRKACGRWSPCVAGAVSSEPRVALSSLPPDSAFRALIGIVLVKACDEGGPIQAGDLLVTASRSGYVRQCEPGECAFIVGKAMRWLVGSEGLILALLTR